LSRLQKRLPADALKIGLVYYREIMGDGLGPCQDIDKGGRFLRYFANRALKPADQRRGLWRS
jgi:hypothetical protein